MATYVGAFTMRIAGTPYCDFAVQQLGRILLRSAMFLMRGCDAAQMTRFYQ
jgi:hypothetical protein